MLWLKKVATRIMSGLLAILPVAVTLYLIYWLAAILEGGVGAVLSSLLPEGIYRPGLGLIVALASLPLIGLLVQTYLVRVLLDRFEQLIDKVPMVKMIYRALRDMIMFFDRGDKRKDSGKPVWVNIGQEDIRLLGFVTLDDLPESIWGSEDHVVVYFPMSYQIGGYTAIVPRERITAADMTFEEAMKFTLTAGVAKGRGRQAKLKSVPQGEGHQEDLSAP